MVRDLSGEPLDETGLPAVPFPHGHPGLRPHAALLAALPGFVDYTSLRGSKVKSLGTWHMILNLTVVVLFAINFYLRTESGLDATGGSTMIPFALSLIGVVLLGISGWLGGEMVYVHGVGVDTEGRALIDEEARLRGDSPRRVA